MRVLVLAIAVVLASPAAAEICTSRPDLSIERKGGYRWQYRLLDGRKCWYYSNLPLPREELVWGFTESEFNSDVRVLERKFYRIEDLREPLDDEP